jgi:2-oxoacid:acceptor oxidoreductase gamma subunit (pyruvate/2-ketoisovalerate family)
MERNITEFRLHGRGGQGIVVAASIFAESVFLEGHYARAFSLFGAERRGAPVTAFIRASKERLMPRSRIYNPDFVVVFDATISGNILFTGLKDGGRILLNAGSNWREIVPPEVLEEKRYQIYQVDAREIAWKHKLAIGSFPMVNTVMLGAMARVSGLATLDNLLQSIRQRVSASLDENIKATIDGFESVEEVSGLAANRK